MRAFLYVLHEQDTLSGKSFYLVLPNDQEDIKL